MAGHGLKIPAERYLSHTRHFGGLTDGNTFAEVLGDVIDHGGDPRLLAAAFGLDQLG